MSDSHDFIMYTEYCSQRSAPWW